MKIEITNLTTGETLHISRDVCTTHPAWVHEQLGTDSESELQDCISQINLADYYGRDGQHKGADEYGLSLIAEDSDYGYRITDGNAVEKADDLAKAASICEDWYDYMIDEGRIPDACQPDLDESSLDALNASIGKWESRIAAALGKKDWYGHGNYHVSAASEAGLRLTVERVLR